MSGLDNARETIDDKGLITGIAPDDTFSARIDQGIAKLQANDKFAGLAGLIQGTKQALRIQEANPNIDYDAGAEFTLKLTQPLNWRGTDHGPTAKLEPFPNENGLVDLVNRSRFARSRRIRRGLRTLRTSCSLPRRMNCARRSRKRDGRSRRA
jgi:hypothetical protein